MKTTCILSGLPPGSQINYDFTTPSQSAVSLAGSNWSPAPPSPTTGPASFVRLGFGQFGTLKSVVAATVKDYTFEMLIAIDVPITGFPTIFSMNGSPRAQVNGTGPYLWNGTQSQATGVPTGTWVHVVMGSDGGNYVNRAYSKVNGYAPPGVLTNPTVIFGTAATNMDASFAGKIAICRMYTKLLTQSDVNVLYGTIDPAYVLPP
jgi:Concanavalin A-like lectin/glucanases superfamily